MKRFRFPLQPLRLLRQQKERQAQQHYADALRACEAAAARVRAAGEELNACWAALTRELSAGAPGLQLLRTRAWCNVLELRLKEHAAALEQARLRADATWREMVLAGRDREVLDRLHDKSHRAYLRDAERCEQKLLDELAVHLFSPTVATGAPAGTVRPGL